MIDLVNIFLNGEYGPILNEFDLKVRTGEVVGLIGRAGGGKSEVLRLASGAQRPNRGRLRLAGCDVTNHLHRLREDTALSTPDLAGPYNLTVDGWMNYWSSIRGIRSSDIRDRELKALATFGLLESREKVVHMLSHGQKRCLDLARIWAIDPSIYLLDHPDAFLDGFAFRALCDAIDKVQEKGKTVILSTTLPNLPRQVCHKVVHVKHGAVIASKSKGSDQYKEFIYKAQGWKP